MILVKATGAAEILPQLTFCYDYLKFSGRPACKAAVRCADNLFRAHLRRRLFPLVGLLGINLAGTLVSIGVTLLRPQRLGILLVQQAAMHQHSPLGIDGHNRACLGRHPSRIDQRCSLDCVQIIADLVHRILPRLRFLVANGFAFVVQPLLQLPLFGLQVGDPLGLCLSGLSAHSAHQWFLQLKIELTVRTLGHVAPYPVRQFMATEEHQVVQRSISFVAHQRHPPTD